MKRKYRLWIREREKEKRWTFERSKTAELLILHVTDTRKWIKTYKLQYEKNQHQIIKYIVYMCDYVSKQQTHNNNIIIWNFRYFFCEQPWSIPSKIEAVVPLNGWQNICSYFYLFISFFFLRNISVFIFALWISLGLGRKKNVYICCKLDYSVYNLVLFITCSLTKFNSKETKQKKAYWDKCSNAIHSVNNVGRKWLFAFWSMLLWVSIFLIPGILCIVMVDDA